MLRAPLSVDQGLAAYSARDEFNGSGALTGRVATVGGTWTVVTNSDTDDYTVGSGVAARATTATDTGTGTGVLVGRGVTAGTTSYTTIAMTVDMQIGAIAGGVANGICNGILFRVTNSSNYGCAYITWSTGDVRLERIVAGAIESNVLERVSVSAAAWYRLTVAAYATGVVKVWFAPSASTPVLRGTYYHSDFAGGTLASGTVGIFEFLPAGAGAGATRSVDNFAAWVPSLDAVSFASQSVQLATSGMFREDSTGTAYGPASVVEGDLPRLPVSGQEGRTVQVMVKSSRGDFETLPDLGIDDASVQGNYRPCWLYVPGPFDPTAIAGLEFWFRPESLGDGGDPIATWTNEGSGTSLTQATGANQPIVEDNALNGKPAVSLDSTDFLSIATIPARSTRTVFIVAKQDAFLSSRAVIAFAGSNAELGSATTNQWCWRNNEAAVQVALGGSMTAWTLAGIRVTSTSVADAWLNGGALVNFDPFSSVVSGTSLTVGGGPWVGDVAEIICYSSALSETDRFRVLGYLSRKYPTLGSFGS